MSLCPDQKCSYSSCPVEMVCSFLVGWLVLTPSWWDTWHDCQVVPRTQTLFNRHVQWRAVLIGHKIKMLRGEAQNLGQPLFPFFVVTVDKVSDWGVLGWTVKDGRIEQIRTYWSKCHTQKFKMMNHIEALMSTRSSTNQKSQEVQTC